MNQETQHLHKIIAILGWDIINLERAGNALVEKMQSGSDSGWDEAIDEWNALVNGLPPKDEKGRYRRSPIGTIYDKQ